MQYTLYWGCYPQWTKTFSTAGEAVEATKEYIRRLGKEGQEFKLIQLKPIHLGPI